jgi:hypothetical protein
MLIPLWLELVSQGQCWAIELHAGLTVGSSMMMQPGGAGRGVDFGSQSTRKALACSSEQLAALLNGRAEVVGFTIFPYFLEKSGCYRTRLRIELVSIFVPGWLGSS